MNPNEEKGLHLIPLTPTINKDVPKVEMFLLEIWTSGFIRKNYVDKINI
jgi:hypothetical protein